MGRGMEDLGLRGGLHFFFFFKMGAITAYLYVDGVDPAERGHGQCRRITGTEYWVQIRVTRTQGAG